MCGRDISLHLFSPLVGKMPAKVISSWSVEFLSFSTACILYRSQPQRAPSWHDDQTNFYKVAFSRRYRHVFIAWWRHFAHMSSDLRVCLQVYCMKQGKWWKYLVPSLFSSYINVFLVNVKVTFLNWIYISINLFCFDIHNQTLLAISNYFLI